MRIGGNAYYLKVNMKYYWILFLISTSITVYSKSLEKSFFNIKKDNEQALDHIALDSEEVFENDFLDESETSKEDHIGHSLLEIDEKDESLLPWIEENLLEEGLEEDMNAYVQKKAKEIAHECDDVFSYEFFSEGQQESYRPTFERIPEEKKSIFVKPKLVPIKEEKISEETSSKVLREKEAKKKGHILKNSSH